MKGSALMSVTYSPGKNMITGYLRWKTVVKQAAAVMGGSLQIVDRRNSDYVMVFHPDGWIILPRSTFMLKEMDVICCNCDYISGPTVL